MTSRSRCEVVFEDASAEIPAAAEVNTRQKYRIREIRGGTAASAFEDSVMRAAAGSLDSVDRC